MNILIPHSWLLEHLETKASPEEIQTYLSLAGPSVERIYDKAGEPVYDIEVTTNRVDSMSVRGIAREAAVILSQFELPSKLKPLQLPKLDKPKKNQPLPKIVFSEKLNSRIMCVLLTDIDRVETPTWMANRLQQIDINVHDAAIDITNYVTHDLGHPCHAFDYDKLMELGGEIKIVEAAAGKPFTTLDGAEYTTVGGEVVFENPTGEIIDLPGIKGTASSSVTDSTKNVLLLIDSVEPTKIRFASMTHAIRTVAAQLNEKNVDPHLAEPVLLSAAKLYQDICGAVISSQVYDDFPAPAKPEKITVPLKKISDYLGLQLPKATLKTILKQLDCRVSESKDALSVTPPSFRPDLRLPVDVIEEIARIYGYHRLPSTIMPTAIPLDKPTEYNFRLEHKIKQFLATLGWQEIYSYSMVSQELAEESGYQLEDHLKLQNPLTDDRVYLRRSLVPSLAEVLTQNRDQKDVSVFELAHVYHPEENSLPAEQLQLVLVSNQDYRTVKGQLEALLEHVFVRDHSVQPVTQTNSQFAQQAAVYSNQQTIGSIGITQSGLVAIEIEMADLLQVVTTHPIYQPLPKTAEVFEDVTFTLPKKTLIGEVISTIKDSSNLVTRVELKDQYQHNVTFTITFHDPDQNISSQAIEPVRKKLVKDVAETHQGQLVGSV